MSNIGEKQQREHARIPRQVVGLDGLRERIAYQASVIHAPCGGIGYLVAEGGRREVLGEQGVGIECDRGDELIELPVPSGAVVEKRRSDCRKIEEAIVKGTTVPDHQSMMLEAAPVSTTESSEQTLLRAIAPLQARLAAHPLYRAIRTVEALHVFMESHVYAVWDFMSLLKSLQRSLTCVEVPWRPMGDSMARRLINEIVLGEESDLYEGEAISHFELYLRAMEGCGAATGPVRVMLSSLATGRSFEAALSGVPVEAAAFVRSTFAVIATGEPHRIAAAFTFGREDLIPEIFPAFVSELDEQLPGKVAAFQYYLERHIEMDGDEHGPMALRMMRSLCPDQQAWAEAQEAAIEALTARLALWDGILRRIEKGDLARDSGGSG